VTERVAGEALTGYCGLAELRRDNDDQSVDFFSLDSLKCLADNLMRFCGLPALLRVLSEALKTYAAAFAPQNLARPASPNLQVLLLLRRYRLQARPQSFQ